MVKEEKKQGSSPICLGNLKVYPGEKKSGYVKVNGCHHNLPVTIIRGKGACTLLVTAGIHSAEYVGIQAAIELSKELEPADIRGNLIIMPMMNMSGFYHRTMSMVHEDGKNLNRVFPGSPDGTAADRISYAMVHEVFPLVDYYMDLHSGDGYEELIPYVYYVGPVEEKVKQAALHMAQCVDTKYIVESNCVSGGAYNHANSMGIPSILLERGQSGIWNKEEVDLDKKDVKNVIHYLFDGEENRRMEGKPIFSNVVYEYAPYTGCWYTNYRPGEMFREGAVLGEIRNYFGSTIYTCKAPADGMVLFQTASLNVLEEGPMITYAILDPEA